MDTAHRADLYVQLEVSVGDFIIEGDVLASVWAPEEPGAEVVTALHAALQLGRERTNQQDVSRGLIELTDIGVRALSPGTNDPTTAIVSVDRVTEVLTRLASRTVPDGLAYDAGGTLRLKGMQKTFDAVALPPYAILRHYGAAHPEVAIRLIESMGRLAMRLPPEERAGLLQEIVETVAAAERSISSEADLGRVRGVAENRVAVPFPRCGCRGALEPTRVS